MNKILIILMICSSFSQNYRGAELRSIDPALYGRFEVCYKPAQGEGLVSSFFTYNDDAPNTDWNEIDIELLGRFPNVVDMNVITNTSHLRTHYTSLNTHLDFNVYGFEWTPDYVAWFINGEEVYRQTDDHVGDLIHPSKIMMNIWNPSYDDWVGFWDDRVLPRFAYYDWVRYSSYTPGNGDVGSDNNFTFQWQDDFDEFDVNHWEKSHNHTWGGNQSLFIEENIVFQDGYLILCLTDNENIGFQDQKKPYLLWARANGDSIIVQFSEELDPVTSQTANNYTIPGVVINEVMLMDNLRTVHLKVSDLNINNDYTLYVLGIKDDAQPPNTQVTHSCQVDMPQPLSFPLKINNSGGQYNNYVADQLWSSSVEYGHMNGNYQSTNEEIGNTDQDELYRESLNRVVSYKVRVPRGVFSVTLKLSENFYDDLGDRSFDVFIEDSMWISNLDIYSYVGMFNAFDTTLSDIKIEDGVLDLYFSAVNYGEGYEYAGPFLNGLEINLLEELVIQSDNPEEFSLLSIYPNPFNNRLKILLELTKPELCNISVYNIKGQLIKTIHDGLLQQGKNHLFWDSKNTSSGLYIIQSKINKKIKNEKTILLK